MGGLIGDVTQRLELKPKPGRRGAATGPLPIALNSKHHQTAMGPFCMLRSVLQQDPITPYYKQLTLHGSPLLADVIAAAGPHHVKCQND